MHVPGFPWGFGLVEESRVPTVLCVTIQGCRSRQSAFKSSSCPLQTAPCPAFHRSLCPPPAASVMGKEAKVFLSRLETVRGSASFWGEMPFFVERLENL